MDEELAECLLMWVQTFSVEGEKDSVQALSDGAALAQILHEVSPSYFDEAWLSGVKGEEANNKHLKMSNLKKVLKGVLSFYDEELGMKIQESKKPNLKLIVENTNLIEMGRLLQLVLGCAVNCDNKQDYIQAIMGMEESVQHGVMTAIQELMSQDMPSSSLEHESVDVASQLQNSLRELSDVKQANIELSERCRELDSQVTVLLEEKSQWETQHSTLTEKAADDIDDPNTSAGKKYQALQQQLEQYKDEVYRLDAAKEDYRMKYEHCHKDLEDLQSKADSLSALADEARTLKDEVDILRQNEEKVKVYESTIESYKRKLEDMADLRRTVKVLEEKNTSYMEKSVEWEDELKKTSALKSQIEVYKRQVQELQSKVTNETKRADKSDFESKRIQEKFSGLQKENDRLAQQVQSYKDKHEEMEFSKLTQMSSDANTAGHTFSHPYLSTDADSSSLSLFNELNSVPNAVITSANLANHIPDTTKYTPQGSGDEDLELLSLPPQLKEKFIRLQTENRVLNKKLSEAGDSITIQSSLEDAQSRINELESESRISNQRVMELEAQVEDLQEASQKPSAVEGDAYKELKQKLVEYSNSIKTLETELHKKKQYIETCDSRITDLTQSLKDKDEKLQQRENEMKQQEEKYKKYLEKAKSVITKMDSTQSADSSTSPQLEMLRGQLIEKEKLIAQIQTEADRQKHIKDQEEKLVVSAWYNLGMSLHRKAVEERLSQYSSGQSFLARQRQVHSKRAGTPLTPSNR